MGILVRVVAVGGLLLVGACVPESGGEGLFDAQQLGRADVVDDGGLLPGEIEAVVVPELDGTWLHYHQMSTCVDVGQGSFELVNRTLYIVETTESADDFGTLQESWTACDIELSPVLGLTPRLPEGQYTFGYPFTTEQGLVTGTAVGSRYASGAVAELWGLTMTEPVSEPMPSLADCTRVPGSPSAVSCADDRVIDMDQDGLPGITLTFNDGVCQAFVVQRTTNYFQGEFVRPDRIEGNPSGPYGGAVGYTGQVILDATTPLCTTTYSTRSNDAYSGWARQRIDGLGGSLDLDTNADGVIECDEVVDVAPSLFNRRPSNDVQCERE